MNKKELLSELNFLKTSIILLQTTLIAQTDINTHHKAFFDDIERRLKNIESTDDEDTASDEGSGIQKDELSAVQSKVISGCIEKGHEFIRSYN